MAKILPIFIFLLLQRYENQFVFENLLIFVDKTGLISLIFIKQYDRLRLNIGFIKFKQIKCTSASVFQRNDYLCHSKKTILFIYKQFIFKTITLMLNWFECKIKYEKTVEEGKIVKVNETYLVDALSFTEAETRINEEMKPFISGEFIVSNIRRARINELFTNENGDKWYRSKVYFISLDEEKGIEKRTACTMMVQANNVKEAWDGLQEGMKGTMSDYEIAAISETTILDVYPFAATKE